MKMENFIKIKMAFNELVEKLVKGYNLSDEQKEMLEIGIAEVAKGVTGDIITLDSETADKILEMYIEVWKEGRE